ncbi:MAG: sigma-70 family RNA polymerase sigma factor [Jatrophihabitantaceae bacterium]
MRSLAELVNEALLGLGMQRALSPVGPSNYSMTVDVTPDARQSRRHASPLPKSRPKPVASPVQPPVKIQDVGPDGAGHLQMDEEHSQTWGLVARAQAGDGEAFGELYDKYVDVVFRFIYFRVNDRGLAEDFTSETFLRALRRITTISYQGRDIGAWFVTIARNIVLDHMKSARRRLEITTADTLEGGHHEPSPEATVLASLTSERLMTAIRTLGAEQQECIMLRFIQGFSVSETAHAMGKNDGAIKALQHRAVRKLAELVGGELR